MHAQRIAIIGAGTAGLATASYLAKQQHEVTVFDQIPRQGPVGAGVLLQPSGQRVLAELGILDTIQQQGSRIDALHGVNHWRIPVLHLCYRDAAADAFGIGIHRAHLARELAAAAVAAGATIRYGATVSTLSDCTLEINEHQRQSFDAVIIANGTRSLLSNALRIPQRKTPYPWGALWAIVESEEWPEPQRLLQRYRGARNMMGILPTGLHPVTGRPCYSLFWSLPSSDYIRWRSEPFHQWQDALQRFWPEAKPLIERMQTDQVYWASYADIVMKRWHDQNRLCIGDAAHAMSPQLGQGVNLALQDAQVLSTVMQRSDNIGQAFAEYSRQRRRTLNFYQTASRWMTPLYQSNWPVGWLRDLSSLASCHLPMVKTINLRVLCGGKTSTASVTEPSPELS